MAILVIAFAAKARAQERQVSTCLGASRAAKRAVRRIVVSIPDRKLVLLEDGRVLLSFRIAVGAPASPSPNGTFRVADMVADPVYYHPGEAIPPGADNPVGPRWIGLSIKGFGIHGTNEPRLIGRRASHGCIRLNNRDVKILFAYLRIGDAVELHAQRDAETAQLFGNGPAPVLVASADAPKPDASSDSEER
ncbi:MAG TPA: L,D-transpeptidase [Candidatus Acidoferrales bacterium]|nr:L,D-transpeptidase [Candidatus Acidoferrales bacterium]